MSKILPSYLTITNDLALELDSTIQTINPDKIALLMDENTKKYCLPKLGIEYDKCIEIKSGEAHKTLDTCDQIWSELTELNFSRKSLLINLGGGVIGDMGGFVAATFKRGIRFVNLPTTLLSQVDASIGGKLGVDFGSLKNHIGVFKNPNKVIIYPGFLETLSGREIKSGFAEVIKHGLIYDLDYWEVIKERPAEDLDWASVIKRSVEIKNEIVQQDPFEGGLRKILNFGHTLGHAIESHLLSTPDHLLHGEAIALGMILETHLSLQLGMISNKDFVEVSSFLIKNYQPPLSPEPAFLEPFLAQDKKNENNRIKFSLLERKGKCTYDVEVSEDMIISSINAYNQMKRS